jgi:TP901 family phage tail tape measure protein
MPAGLRAALSVAGLMAAGKAALDTADDLSKLSQKTGISVESLSLLKPIAEQSGISLEGLAKGMQKLATAMVEAAGGSKEQIETFSRLGVSVKDAAGQIRPTEAVLLDLADAFAALPDGAEKSALAVKIFGKAGVELIPFLNQGRAGIEELKQKFKELGLEISGDTAKAAEKFNDTLDTV